MEGPEQNRESRETVSYLDIAGLSYECTVWRVRLCTLTRPLRLGGRIVLVDWGKVCHQVLSP
jgi:hypothetical protein